MKRSDGGDYTRLRDDGDDDGDDRNEDGVLLTTMS